MQILSENILHCSASKISSVDSQQLVYPTFIKSSPLSFILTNRISFTTDLPKFFCDQCDFYSLRSADLIQHYKMVHHRVDENGKTGKEQAQGIESRVYSCDMCLFETSTVSQLRTHYKERHTVQPTEVQLRPSWTGEPTTTRGVAAKQQTPAKILNHTDIPLGIKCES